MKKHCSPLLSHSRLGIPLFSLAFALLLTLHASAQAPKMFNFQGVARDASGKVVANAEVGYSFNIHEDSPAGQSVFAKEGYATTNSSGIFNVTIGTTAAPLPDLPWSSKSYYLQVGVDADGATNGFTFVDVGTTQLLSVPYALYSNEAGKWRDNEPIVQTGIAGSGPTLPALNAGANLIWYPRKAAFRAGQINSPSFWEDANIGVNSFSTGANSIASGESSIAMGNTSTTSKIGGIAIGSASNTSGDYGVAIGRIASASGANSISVGYSTTASGESSVAIGLGTIAKSLGAVTLGAFNNSADPGVFTEPTNRIFQIGNGSTSNNRSNAMTILRNGNIGIGNNVLIPEYIMDFGGRPRIRHNGATAGLFFNNSQNVAEGFVGMKTDNQIGFFANGAWKLWSDELGSCFITGAGYYLSSDIKLKTNISRVKGSLSKLTKLNGYNYNWLEKERDNGLLTGIIAQEVRAVFPELTSANESGILAVNYTGLIPHLIEAVKELDQKTSEIVELKKELAQMKELNKRMAQMEAGLKTLLTGNTSAIGKPQTK
jgi:hypothetical protein